jgi:hypothetical protein
MEEAVSERDPRVDPRPGDVLRKNGLERSIIGAAASGANESVVEYTLSSKKHPPLHRYQLHQLFLDWAKSATIITKAAHD